MKSISARDRDKAGRVERAEKAALNLPAKSRTKRSAKGLSVDAKQAIVDAPDALQPNDGNGRKSSAEKAFGAAPNPSSRAGQSPVAVCAIPAVPVSASPIDGGEEGRIGFAALASLAAPSSPSVDQLAELQVRRKAYISATNKQTNAIKALVRRALGWRYDEEEGDRDKVNKRAGDIVKAALNGKDQKPEDAPVFAAVAGTIAVFAQSLEPMQAARHATELEMKRLARKLPVYAWAKEVHGLGDLGLAVIVAEAGDLAKYPKKGHLWKRLGLAVHDGKAYSTWRGIKGGLTAEQWTEAGYSPRRRAEVFAVISEPLFRAQSVASGPYRAIYDRRRAATAIAHEDWTKAHSHMDALRVMTKYLLRDLWQEWRRAERPVLDEAIQGVPAADTIHGEAAEQVPELAIAALPTSEAHDGAL